MSREKEQPAGIKTFARAQDLWGTRRRKQATFGVQMPVASVCLKQMSDPLATAPLSTESRAAGASNLLHPTPLRAPSCRLPPRVPAPRSSAGHTPWPGRAGPTDFPHSFRKTSLPPLRTAWLPFFLLCWLFCSGFFCMIQSYTIYKSRKIEFSVWPQIVLVVLYKTVFFLRFPYTFVFMCSRTCTYIHMCIHEPLNLLASCSLTQGQR